MDGAHIEERVTRSVCRTLASQYVLHGRADAFRDAVVFQLHAEDLCGAATLIAQEAWLDCAREVAEVLLLGRARRVFGALARVVVDIDDAFILQHDGVTIAVLGEHPMDAAEELDVFVGCYVASRLARWTPPGQA